MKFFLCGDVMTGRGIDQIFRHSCDPEIHEPYMNSALDYVQLAEQRTGVIPRPVDPSYIWGDALDEFAREKPDFRIINLETAMTTHGEWLPKGINYRMHPANIDCLRVAGIDCCALANNHVLDWGVPGLLQTLDTLKHAGIAMAGAGSTLVEAKNPAILRDDSGARALVFAYAMESSGVPAEWMAKTTRPGVNFLPDLSPSSVHRVVEAVKAVKKNGDVVVFSIHWGGNWGYEISSAERKFAHQLIEKAGVDVFHGHSSHHPKGIEVYLGKPVIYGCGDFINDYEGISGYEEFRSELGLMYFVSIEPSAGCLRSLTMTPTQIMHFRVHRAQFMDARWLEKMLGREGRRFGTRTWLQADGTLELSWK